MKSGIYKIQSIIKPERFYIGSSIDLVRRFRLHNYELRKKSHHCIKLQNHFNKYGESDLRFIILDECGKDELISKEQIYLDELQPYFNICKTAGSKLGIEVTKETRDKLSKSNKGKVSNWKGVKRGSFTDEHKRKLKEARKRQKPSYGMLGKSMSDETKEKMRISALKRPPRSEMFKQKIKDSWVIRKLNKTI